MPAGQHSHDPRGRQPETPATPTARHILVVDDDAAMREMISDYLGNQNFKVSAVADGEGMSRVLRDGAVDLVILDMKLAREDGLDLMRRLGSPPDAAVI
ncbi:MAG: response regulator, partial [Woeseiaceae bacterium]